MASGSFNISSSNQYVAGTVTWTSTKDEANNRSLVNVKLRMERTNSGYTTYGSGTFYIAINGSQGSKYAEFTLTYNSNTLIYEREIYVSHNSDGTKSCTIAVSASTNVFSVSSQSRTATLDTIPRKSTLTNSPNFTAGNGYTVTWSRESSNFVHTVVLYANGVEVARGSNVGGTSYAFNIDHTEVFNQLNGGASQDTKVLLITYPYAGGSEIGRDEHTGTVTAPSASTISSGTDRTVDIDGSIFFGITRANSQFTHTLKIYLGATLIKTITGVTTSTTWTPSASEKTAMYNTIPNANYIDGNIEVFTYYNGELVRSATDNDMDFYLYNAEPTFGTGFTYRDSNTTVPSPSGTVGITGNNQYIIQGKSNLLVEIPTGAKATANKGASMTKYKATFNGVTAYGTFSSSATVTIDLGTTTASSGGLLTVTAIDSRGNETSAGKSVLVVPYSPPTVSANVTRLNNFEAQTTITLSGSMSTLNVGGTNKNALASAKYRTKLASSGSYGSDVNFSVSGFPNYTATNVNLTLDNLQSFHVQVEVKDKLSTVTITKTVSTGQPILFMDSAKKSVGINKFPSGSNRFEVQGDIQLSGNIVMNGSSQITGLTTVGTENPNNSSATAHLGWKDDIARIRFGGSGVGSGGGFKIQGTGDADKLYVDNNSTLYVARIRLSSTDDASSNGTLHGLTIGNDITGESMKMDANELSSYNGSNTSVLHLNPDGGSVRINNSVGYTGDINDGLVVYNQARIFSNGGNTLELHGTDHSYIEYFAKGHNGTRTGYIGYPSSATTFMTIYTSDAIRLIPANGAGHSSGFVFDAVSNGGIDFGAYSKLKFLTGSSELQARNQADTAYAHFACNQLKYQSQSNISRRDRKKNIVPYDTPSLEILNSIPLYTFSYIEDTDEDTLRMGTILDEAPEFFRIDDEAIDTSKVIWVLVKSVQELSEQVKYLERKLLRR